MMTEERLPSGIPGLDEVLHGGLLSRRSYLIVGSAGTGKTILALQYLREGSRRGEKVLYITLAEPAQEIERNMTSFGWRLNGIEMLDLTPADGPTTVNGEYHVFAPSEVEHVPTWRSIYEAVAEKQPQRLVIDSVTQLRYLSTDEYQFRKHMLGLVAYLGRNACTSLLTFEPSELERETSVGLAVDGLIRLRTEVSAGRVIGLRSLHVEKLRGSDFVSGYHPMRITGDGIVVFPHRIEGANGSPMGAQMLSSSIPQLDELLGGGLESGTTTIVTGPSGVGKSTVCTQLLTVAAASGRRATMFTFEESVKSIVARSRGVGISIDACLEDGTLKIIRLNPMELYPDEFLAMVRAAVEQDGCEVLMVDSIRGYEMAMEQFGSAVAHTQNLVNYLHRRSVTLLLVNEVERITGDLSATELGISHVADNILLLRYAEDAGRVIKVIACLKKRLGNFQPELRELRLSADGIEVGEKLDHLYGILTGTPMGGLRSQGRGSRKGPGRSKPRSSGH